MTNIPAENYTIVIHDGIWQLLPSNDALSTHQAAFQITRGSGVMEYTPGFAQAHKLPGTVLSVNYVRAVVIGYDDKTQCWRLGFHVARNQTEKPRWLELVHWPVADNLADAAVAQQAGRELAEYIGCPLKIFGAKKLAADPSEGSGRSGSTGPLIPHKREEIGPQRVKLFAQSVKLPIQYPHMWLGTGRNGVTLKLSKDITSSKKGQIAPSYNQCVIDPEQKTIRMVPPTGLLGTFLGGQQARIIKTGDVHNVELRHTIEHKHTTKAQNKNMLEEITYTTYTWDVYLTLTGESLLVAQTTHVTDSELMRKRAMVGDKFSIDSQAGIEYLRQHQEDQEAYENAETFAWTVSVVIASTLGIRIVKTEIAPDT